MVKSSQNVIGSVTCCPGCFSLYRGAALRDVMSTFSQPSSSAYDTLVKDNGRCNEVKVSGWCNKGKVIGRYNKVKVIDSTRSRTMVSAAGSRTRVYRKVKDKGRKTDFAPTNPMRKQKMYRGSCNAMNEK